MNAVALMYHDVIAAGLEHASGFPAVDAALYKLTPEQFALHLRCIAGASDSPVSTVDSLGRPGGLERTHASHLFLTFDDGGASSDWIGAELEERGWRGHFFVTGACIGRPGFLTPRQIRDLRKRGHVIGSHSQTHPLRMRRWPAHRLLAEWSRSAEILADITGERIVAASVPGGDYTPAIVDAAAQAGFRYLFTSEPTVRILRRGPTLVIGRFAMRRSTPAHVAAAIVAGTHAARLQQLGVWKLKGVAKAIGGDLYLDVRRRLLGAGPAQWGDELHIGSEP